MRAGVVAKGAAPHGPPTPSPVPGEAVEACPKGDYPSFCFMPTQRYKLTIAYRGTRYHGWQRQAAGPSYGGPTVAAGAQLPTIQEALCSALASVVGHPVQVVGSSRTDAGVHAKGQVAHFDTDQTQIPPEGLRRAANARLPEDILIREIEPVGSDFDAISCTTSKRYQYLIWNAAERPVLFADLAWHRWQTLDCVAMAEAAALLVGEHDFASFAKPGHGRENTVRTVRACDVAHRPPRIVIGIAGNGFLWHMVRIMVGTLVEVGLGRYSPQQVRHMLEARDRRAAGPTAPAHGLYLQWVQTSLSPGLAASRSGVPAHGGDAPIIREFGRSDLPEIMAVAQSLPHWFTDAAMERMSRDLPFSRGFMALLGRRVVGFVAFVVRDGIGWITWMGVRPELHRRGIGRRLVQRLIVELRRYGIGELRVQVPGEGVPSEPYEHTRAFYRAMGFADLRRSMRGEAAWREELILRLTLEPQP